MPGAQLDPGKVKKPIQLLAVMIAGLVILVGSFLTAATKIEKPAWAAGLLLITAVAIVPVFVGVVVMMWTRFRVHLQDDHYYADWLDLDRLAGYLDRLRQRRLYAVVGFYLEGEASRLCVPPEFLARLARGRPRARIYLEPRQRGGRLQARWNLIVPDRWARERPAVEV